MFDSEYHMAQVRNISESSNENNNELCRLLLCNLELVINETRSVLAVSTTTNYE